jgi:hypothetical protein
MATNKTVDAAAKLVGILEPLTDDERHRTLTAALTLLGSEFNASGLAPASPGKSAVASPGTAHPKSGQDAKGFFE